MKNSNPPHQPAFFASATGIHILFKRTYKPRKNGKPVGNEFVTINGQIKSIKYNEASRTVQLEYVEDKGQHFGSYPKILSFKKVSLSDHNSFVKEYYEFVRGETFIEKL